MSHLSKAIIIFVALVVISPISAFATPILFEATSEGCAALNIGCSKNDSAHIPRESAYSLIERHQERAPTYSKGWTAALF